VNKYTEGADMEWSSTSTTRPGRRNRFHASRNSAHQGQRAVGIRLKALEKAAVERKNVMPFLVDCCKAYATVGEMAGVFRRCTGSTRSLGFFDWHVAGGGLLVRDA